MDLDANSTSASLLLAYYGLLILIVLYGKNHRGRVSVLLEYRVQGGEQKDKSLEKMARARSC